LFGCSEIQCRRNKDHRYEYELRDNVPPFEHHLRRISFIDRTAREKGLFQWAASWYF
jgi:hypothetical protein